jgi:predicted nucleic acid-binding protein
MIILDTNVVSEVMKPQPDLEVKKWLDSQRTEALYLTATSLGELLAGIATMPDGRRKDGFARVLQEFRGIVLNHRILPFDDVAASAYASLVARARTKGRAIAIADGQIAAIGQVHGFIVATRDTSPFEAAGVAFLNPWEG